MVKLGKSVKYCAMFENLISEHPTFYIQIISGLFCAQADNYRSWQTIRDRLIEIE